MSESQNELQPLLSSNDVEATPVYPLIQLIRADVTHTIDTPLSYETLTSPEVTIGVLQPLVDKYAAIQQEGNLSVVFCILLNRVHFIRDEDLFTATLSKSRADFCELLAIRVFRENAYSLLDLTVVLTTVWHVYAGADPRLLEKAKRERDDELENRVGNAIELAILGKAKRFIKSTSCRRVIEAIWSGRCVYQAQSTHSILSDTYKRTPVHFYDPHKAPLLDHYRLKVPSIRSVLEYMNFIILFVLYVTALEFADIHRFNLSELLFIIYSLGFTLEKVAAMQEHGIRVYFKGTWNAFDLAFVTSFAVYVILRLYGINHHKYWAKALGIDTLALIACLLFPRLAFVTFKNNLMVLSLRAMMLQFVLLMCIAMFCFCGFLYALWTFSRNGAGFEAGEIAWWMLDLWFGLDASGFQNATRFHPTLGPVLMVIYACLSNTLLLTVLVSILSNTFAKINEDAAAEAMFRKAVLTIEGVKADSLFSYQPPINLFAVCVMLPASYILSPRWFHKVNVFMIRATSFPILLIISFYERQAKAAGSVNFSETISHIGETVFDTLLPRPLKRMSIFEGFAGSEGDIDAIFEIAEDSEDAVDLNEDDDGSGNSQQRLRRGSGYSYTSPKRPVVKKPSRSPGPQRALPRLRTNALMPPRPSDSVSFSPLTQVYQPVIFTEDVDDGSGTSLLPPATSTALSYGAASRRRINSMVPGRRGGPDPLLAQAQMNNAMKKFPGGLSPPSPPERGGGGNGAVDIVTPRGRSGERNNFSSSLGQVQELEGSEEMGTPTPEPSLVEKRLDDIERRQERIESLLSQLVDGISRGEKSG
ncbi:receptor-activated Ca2+-permeable cation channel [Ephemerocybe angulata]|uniref:Receptor-activated Ca2+-permeable cation channel n=1 Tax=Ephemerocybe angulata TaxID=980116 RepID=A0A8H6MF50_9AGAR|nr:receptor-activated Ca2+-permeable cation channel [Tulosesus angulatus]